MINNGYLKASRNNDECYTPHYAVNPLIKYIDPQLTVWCPFDTINSAFVNELFVNGNKVIFSHINDDKDFKGNIIKLNNIGGKTDPIFLNKGNWSETILYDDSKRTHETENYDGINIKELADADYDTYERCSINAKRIINVRSSKILKMVLNE